VPDFVGKLGGVPVVMEFKASDYMYRDNYDFRQIKQYSEWVRHHNAGMQVAAYANAWNQTTGDDIHAEWSLTARHMPVSYLLLKET